jgi:hypothetical protein
MSRTFLDKAVLILCALLVFGGVLGVGLIAKYYFGLEERWILFVFASLSFSLTFFYVAATTPTLRMYRTDVRFLPWTVGFGLFPIILAGALFVLEWLPMPSRVYPYLLVALALVPALILGLKSLLERLRTRHPPRHRVSRRRNSNG